MAELLYTRATHSRKASALSIEARFCFYSGGDMDTQEIKSAAERRTTATRQAIVRQRKAAGISQIELGRLVGQDRFSIHRLESGKRPIYMTELCEIAHVLGVDPIELLRSEVA